VVQGIPPVAGAPVVADAVQEDRWLADILRRPVFAVAALSGAAAAATERAARTAEALLYAKIPTDRVALVSEFVNAGFHPVDVAITLARRSEPRPAPPRVTVRRASPADRETVAAIAAAAFVWSRFNLDPLISDGAAQRIKREWAANCVEGSRGVGALVAVEGEEVVGFVAALDRTWRGQRATVIDLIAVHPDRQRAGVGGALVDAFIRAHGSGSSILLVGTQAANVASLALYEGRGFRTVETAYVLHCHAGRPA
jgi:ribosomal protein S18 acetylase RimI-like enzyme